MLNMKSFKSKLSFLFIVVGLIGIFAFTYFDNQKNQNILSHIVDLQKQDLKLYWKNDEGKNFKNFKSLKEWLESKSEILVFAMNGGMYLKDLSPQGLFIENGLVKTEIDTVQKGYGNFYMQPNGIFYITKDKKGFVCKTADFTSENVAYATQSGPMLLINGKMHPKFIKGSKNLNIRNGVGILPNGNLLFAMSKQKINFYDFASYFKSFGCKNALYLDGFISKTYLPEKSYRDLDGKFGVIIGETKKKDK